MNVHEHEYHGWHMTYRWPGILVRLDGDANDITLMQRQSRLWVSLYSLGGSALMSSTALLSHMAHAQGCKRAASQTLCIRHLLVCPRL